MNTKFDQYAEAHAEANEIADRDGEAAIGVAIAIIAALFYDPYEHTDHQTGVVETRNALGFWQDKALSGLLYQLKSGLEYSRQTTLPRAKAAAQTAMRAHKGDELSEVALNRAIDWVQRLNEQLAYVEAVTAIADRSYTDETGKVHEYRSRSTANQDVVETGAMARAKALGIGVTNVAAGFGSAEPIRSEQIERLPDQHGKTGESKAKALKAAKVVKEFAKLRDAG